MKGSAPQFMLTVRSRSSSPKEETRHDAWAMNDYGYNYPAGASDCFAFSLHHASSSCRPHMPDDCRCERCKDVHISWHSLSAHATTAAAKDESTFLCEMCAAAERVALSLRFGGETRWDGSRR